MPQIGKLIWGVCLSTRSSPLGTSVDAKLACRKDGYDAQQAYLGVVKR